MGRWVLRLGLHCLRSLACLRTAFSLVRAGVIAGTVIEHQSGRPLARTVVRLQPIPRPGDSVKQSNESRSFQTRTESSGGFTFPGVPDGLYLILATREYYFPAAYGQKRPTGQGTPIEVTSDSKVFAELRMRRMGVVTGHVLDENDIGMPDIPVVAYRARFPLRSVGRGISDDRGVYRIFNLEPGKYWVRTVSHTLDDGSGRLPTFGPEGMETREARLQEVRVDEETAYADVRPVPGRLFHLGGLVVCPFGSSANVTLSSEIERKSMQVACGGSYQFEGLAPALYEVFAETKDAYSGFLEQFVDRNMDSASVNTGPSPRVDVEVRNGDTHSAVTTSIILMGHRQDLSDLGKDQPIATHATLPQGHWLMNAQVGATQYVESIAGSAVARDRHATQPSDAFDVLIAGGSTRITVTISDRAGQLEGSVAGPDSKPIPGSPVFLWPVTEAARRSLGGAKLALADSSGYYTFTGLPPGDYRVLASFDLSEVDEEVLDAARAPVTRLDAGQRITADLPLWIAP
jgi:hypothetical protein